MLLQLNSTCPMKFPGEKSELLLTDLLTPPAPLEVPVVPAMLTLIDASAVRLIIKFPGDCARLLQNDHKLHIQIARCDY